MLLCITYRAVQQNERTKADFMYFVKGLVERYPSRTSTSPLLFCRGVLNLATTSTVAATAVLLGRQTR